MKASFVNFWKKNLGFSQLAIQQQLEYRVNFAVDALIQPFIALVFEVLLWMAVFRGSGQDRIGGFPMESYLAYAIWGTYIARVAANWMYEHRMIEQINTGQVNSILLRPTSFFEYFLFQFLGYKVLIIVLSLIIPASCILIFGYPTHFHRLPLALMLILYFLVFTYCLSFSICSLAFQFNKIHSFTFSKNITLWVITGELFPLDLIPEPLKTYFVLSPFSAGVYIPVGYLTGRLEIDMVMKSFISVTLGILVLVGLGMTIWKTSLRTYSGTGA